jgi:hypothetical protein
MTLDRRQVLAGTSGALLTASFGSYAETARGTSGMRHRPRVYVPPLIADIERRTFRFFWDRVNKKNGLFPDRWPTPSFASIAAIGFALTAYPIGVERGWISRQQARDMTLTTLRFFHAAPMGEEKEGVTGHRGFYYHFLDIETGHRFRDTELSTVDSALLFLGMLFASGWFSDETAQEAEIRKLATEIIDRADWNWFLAGGDGIAMGWLPEQGFISRRWDGYNEGMFVYLLALGSGANSVPARTWSAWTAPYDKFWRGSGATRHLAFAPLFGHQYGEMWIDYRGIRDAPMRAAGFDYFENSRRATFANRAYCIANPLHWDGYTRDIWGLTACDGPGNFTFPFKGRAAEAHGYSARGPIGQPDGLDDGTIAPTAALSSIAFAPEICIPAAEAMHREHGSRIYSEYGFKDAFNPSCRDISKTPENGTIDVRHGWVGADYLGIDQGPILGMIANYRTEAIWRVMRKVPHIVRGLKRAGFTGGWLDNS